MYYFTTIGRSNLGDRLLIGFGIWVWTAGRNTRAVPWYLRRKIVGAKAHMQNQRWRVQDCELCGVEVFSIYAENGPTDKGTSNPHWSKT
jgi:hypothetical protein